MQTTMATTKPGQYGTLHLYLIAYKNTCPKHAVMRCSCGYEGTYRTYAYDAEHAEDNFYGGADEGEGWTVLSIKRAR